MMDLWTDERLVLSVSANQRTALPLELVPRPRLQPRPRVGGGGGHPPGNLIENIFGLV